MYNTGSVFFTGIPFASGGGGGGVASVTAENGVSLDPSSTLTDPIIVLGNELGDTIGQLLDDREIPMNGNNLWLTRGATEYIRFDGGGANFIEILADNNGSSNIRTQNINNGNGAGNGLVNVNDAGRSGNFRVNSSTNNALGNPPDVVLIDGSALNGVFVNARGGGAAGFAVKTNTAGESDTSLIVNPDGHLTVGVMSSIVPDFNNGFFSEFYGNGAYFSSNPDAAGNGSIELLTPGVGNNITGMFIQDVTYQGNYFAGDINLTDFSGNNAKVDMNPTRLNYLDQSDATVFSSLNKSVLSIQNSGGVLQGGYSFGQWGLQDNSTGHFFGSTASELSANDGAGTNMILLADRLNFSDPGGNLFAISANVARVQDSGGNDVAAMTAGAFTAESIITSDVSFLNASGVTVSDATNSSNSILTKTGLQVGNPVSGANVGIADFYGGGITTKNPVSALNDSIWQFGAEVAAVETVNLARHLVVSINGVQYKLATMN